MSFEIVFDSAKEFADLIGTPKNFFDDIRLHITEEGIEIKGMDAARVVLTNIMLPESLFSKYQVSGEEIITISLETLMKALRLGRSKDTLLLRSGNDGRLIVGFLGAEKTFIHLPLIADSNTMESDIPELEWTAKAILLAGAMKRALNAASLANNAVEITINGNSVTFEAVGETTAAKTVLTMEDETLMDVEGPDEGVSSYYGIAYLSDVIKGLGTEDEVILRLGDTMPLLVKYHIRDEGEVKFLIAPMVGDK